MIALDDPKFKAEKWGKEFTEANKEDFGEAKKDGGMEHGAPAKGDDMAATRKAMGLKELPAAKKD